MENTNFDLDTMNFDLDNMEFDVDVSDNLDNKSVIDLDADLQNGRQDLEGFTENQLDELCNVSEGDIELVFGSSCVDLYKGEKYDLTDLLMKE